MPWLDSVSQTRSSPSAVLAGRSRASLKLVCPNLAEDERKFRHNKSKRSLCKHDETYAWRPLRNSGKLSSQGAWNARCLTRSSRTDARPNGSFDTGGHSITLCVKRYLTSLSLTTILRQFLLERSSFSKNILCKHLHHIIFVIPSDRNAMPISASVE